MPLPHTKSRAIWFTAKGAIELRDERLRPPGKDEVLVETLYSGISRGTERLVLAGGVPDTELHRMRAPFQKGDFPFPVKYGYCATGRVAAGQSDLIGREVFVLHPHQDRFVVPAGSVMPIPTGVPARRATLAANMETALNAIWDSGAGAGDRISVVGAGVLGLLVGYLAARMPGSEVTLIDPQPSRTAIVEHLGARHATRLESPGTADFVFHASATSAGLSTALAAAGNEATVIEISWYGDRTVQAPLGGAFHSQRLKLISSQVGSIPPDRRPRWTHRRRLETALALLQDDRLDILVTREIMFDAAPLRLPAELAPDTNENLPPVIRYEPI